MVVTLPVEEEHNNEDNDSVMESKCSEAGVPVVLPLLAADCHPPARFFLLPWLLSLWSGTVKNLFFFLSFFYCLTRVLAALQAGERLELCPLLPSFALRCSGSVAHGSASPHFNLI